MDSEDVQKNDSEIIGEPDDLTSMVGIIGFKPIKISIFIFIMFILINSNVFIDRILSKNKSYVEGRIVTEKGALVQGLLLSLWYLLINTLITHDFI